MLFELALLSVKMLIVTMLIRIFCSARPKVVFFLHIFAKFLVVFCTTMLLLRIFACIPVSALWNGGGRCLNFYPILVMEFSISLMTDLVICALPIFLASTLYLPLKKKIRVAALLGAGALTIPLNIYRLWLVLTPLGRNSDWTFAVIHWSYLGYVDSYPLNNLVSISLMKYAERPRLVSGLYVPVFLP
jgi:hypothetical protein